MPEINWMTILESQQDEFIINLKHRMPAFTRSEYDFDEAIHLYPSFFEYPSVFDDFLDLEEQMNWFCEQLTYKYNYCYFPDKFINYKVGKIGEESVKYYLGKLISNVDYELYEWGDDGKDFYLASNKSVSLQVKTTCFDRTLENTFYSVLDECGFSEDVYFDIQEDYYRNLEHDECEKIIDEIKWKINEKEQQKNQICIFVLLLNQVVGDRMHIYVKIEEIDK